VTIQRVILAAAYVSGKFLRQLLKIVQLATTQLCEAVASLAPIPRLPTLKTASCGKILLFIAVGRSIVTHLSQK
jgi:hypothetical protein